MQRLPLHLRCLSKAPATLVRRRLASSSPANAIPNARRGQNLSARFAPQLPPAPYPHDESAIKAQSAGLSPEGMLNPKTVEAAARLSSSKQQLAGSNVGGGGRDSDIDGVNVVMPQKPSPPGPEDCCMSGCAVCVHDLYIEAVGDYKASLRSIRDELEAKGVHQSLWPKEIIELSPNAETEQEDVDDADLDPAMKAFMQMERQLKQKHKEEHKA